MLQTFARVILLVTIYCIPLNSIAQKRKKALIYNPQSELIFSANEIVYYGLDFTHFKISDFKKINQGQEMKTKYFPALVGRFNNDMPPERVGNYLRKSSVGDLNFIGDLNTIQLLIKDMNPDDIVLANTFILTNDSIAEIVKNYKLKETNGIGFVQIGESFNKAERYLTVFYVFFDIASREVLFSIKPKGLPGSKWGFTDYLYNGLMDTYSIFIDYYRKEKKLYK